MVKVKSNRRGSFKIWGMTEESPSQSLLVTNLDPLLKYTLRSVLGLITLTILKTVRQSIFFSKQQICKVKDGTEVAKSLVPNLCKIIKVSSS